MVKLVIFDFDQTLFNETLNKDVPKIINLLQQNNIKMSIASYNPYVMWFCKRYDIDKYFDFIYGYRSFSKISHVNKIKMDYLEKNIYFSNKDILFIDDDAKNVHDISMLRGIESIKVPKSGIAFSCLSSILPRYENSCLLSDPFISLCQPLSCVI